MKRKKQTVTADGVRITQRDIVRGMRINIGAGILAMVYAGVAFGMPVTMFMEALGASGLAIGLIVTVQQVAMIMQIPGAVMAEKLPRRKLYWGIVAFLHRALWFLPVLIPFFYEGETAGWVLLIIIGVSVLLAHTCTSAWYSWMADLIPESARGRFWGTRQSIIMTAYLITIGLAGYLLDIFSQRDGGSFRGFQVVFLIAAVAGCIDVLVHLWVPEPKPARSHSKLTVLQRLMLPLRRRDFRYATLAFGAWGFVLGLVGSFGFVYLKRRFDVSYTHLAAITICASIGTILTSRFFGKVMDHIGLRTFGALTILISPVFGLVWFFMEDAQINIPWFGASDLVIPQPILILGMVNLVAGAFYSAVPLCQLALTGALAPRRGRTMAMAVHWTIVGVIASLGPLVGGVVMDHFGKHPLPWTVPSGIEFSYYHLLVIMHILTAWFVALPLLLLIRPQKKDFPIRAFIGNPLRGVSIVQNLIALTEAIDVQGRTQAVRRLAKRTPYAVNELSKQLDDPSLDVREEAIAALGRIGSPAAVNELIERLQDPDSDLAPQIARALRYSKSEQGLDVLVSKLSDSDREIQTESARTLGTMGDPEAIQPLLELVQETNDSKVLVASSEALAHLGELTAIYEILPKMKATKNPVVRRSLAVAVGDLLGERGKFYPLLMQEEREPDSAYSEILDLLKRHIRRMAGNRMPTEAGQLETLADRLENLYEDENFEQATDILFDLSLGIATLQYGVDFGAGAKTALADIIWRDPKFAVGYWFIELMHEHWQEAQLGAVERTGILLGTYFLASWSKELQL